MTRGQSDSSLSQTHSAMPPPASGGSTNDETAEKAIDAGERLDPGEVK